MQEKVASPNAGLYEQGKGEGRLYRTVRGTTELGIQEKLHRSTIQMHYSEVATAEDV